MHRFLRATFLTLGCVTWTPAMAATPNVHTLGASSALKTGDLSSHANLVDFRTLKNLYALGPVTRMGGEVTVFDSQPAVALVRDGKVTVSPSWDYQPPFFVYSQVQRWQAIALPEDVRETADLQAFIEKIAAVHGVDLEQAFAFRVTAMAAQLGYHVFNMPPDAVIGAQPLASYNTGWKTERCAVELLGFYSRHHEGVFLGAGARMHIHFRTTDGSQAGHVDDFQLARGGQLWLPQS
jgi:acetolactate decarboxylase